MIISNKEAMTIEGMYAPQLFLNEFIEYQNSLLTTDSNK